ncbi:MAG: hypothetical protein QOE03_1374 [Micromonosporaceae bacterium]|nr:hypothetical protein [Micromonosporaceae bacterium]
MCARLLAAVAVDDATRPGLAFTCKVYRPRMSQGGTNVNAVTAVRDTANDGGWWRASVGS